MPLGVGPEDFPFGTRGRRFPRDEAARERSRLQSSLLRHLRQHGKYLTPGHGITGWSLFSIVLRSLVMGFLSLMLLAMTAFATLIPIAKLQLSLFYSSLWLKGAELADACIGGDGSGDDGVVTAGGQPACIADNSVTKWRIFGVFGFSIGYDVLPYLTASLSYSTLAIHPDSDGNGIENPIWNENTQLALNFQFRPSALARLLREARAGAVAEEGGDEEASRLRPTAF